MLQLSMLSNDELIRYAEVEAVTEMEVMLLKRFKERSEKIVELQEQIYTLEDQVEVLIGDLDREKIRGALLGS